MATNPTSASKLLTGWSEVESFVRYFSTTASPNATADLTAAAISQRVRSLERVKVGLQVRHLNDIAILASQGLAPTLDATVRRCPIVCRTLQYPISRKSRSAGEKPSAKIGRRISSRRMPALVKY